MTYAYINRPGQPDAEVIMPEGQAISGFAIGIVVIDIWYPLMPGNVVNANTYDFPVLYKILKGVGVKEIMSGDPALLDLVIEGGRELVEQGVRAVMGACGLFANYQKKAATVLDVPTFLSVLLQVPMILNSLKQDQKIGIIGASGSPLSQNVCDNCGITDPSRLVIAGAEVLPEFQNILQCKGGFNSRKLEKEVVDLARKLVTDNPEIGAIVVQCSDLPPYSWAIQNAVRMPVFDMTTLINWAQNAVVRRPFGGFI